LPTGPAGRTAARPGSTWRWWRGSRHCAGTGSSRPASSWMSSPPTASTCPLPRCTDGCAGWRISRLRDLSVTGNSHRQVRRIVTDRPDQLIHVDVKKIWAIPTGGGWRVHGRAQDRAARKARVDYRYWHSAIDAHTRLAFTESCPKRRRSPPPGSSAGRPRPSPPTASPSNASSPTTGPATARSCPTRPCPTALGTPSPAPTTPRPMGRSSATTGPSAPSSPTPDPGPQKPSAPTTSAGG